MTNVSKSTLRLALFALVLVAAIVLARTLPVAHWFQRFSTEAASMGPKAYVIMGIAYVLASVLMAPGMILTLVAGAIFGVFRGFLTISVASTLGATASFAIARYVARDAVASRLAGRAKLHAVDQALADRGFRIVGLLRLSPIAPYNVLNYALGLTRVSMRDYVLGSWLGMMPGTLLYVYIGSLAGDIASTDSSRQSRSLLEWSLYLIGLAVTVLTAIYIARLARNAIREAERSNAE